ncbi:Smg-4/UPF3 family-domain-containing protein [Chytriomyces sp. MP71]|nr:Smg-4/UPF3 family-domain-containing protein [Chytriomyces sp. MP71]
MSHLAVGATTAGTGAGKKPTRTRNKKRDAGAAATPAAQRNVFKAVVRRLPPHLSQDVFDALIGSLAGSDALFWSQFVAGKLAKRSQKNHTFSRAYLAFATPEALVAFAQAFNGWLFRDEKAAIEYRASVELAPFQKVPKTSPKQDYRINTIDTDPEYLAFLDSLKAGPVPDAAVAAIPPPSTSTSATVSAEPALLASTPLLDDLRAKKSAQRELAARKKEDLKKKKAVQGAVPTRYVLDT